MKSRTKFILYSTIAGALAGTVAACSTLKRAENPPTVADEVDLQKYMGTWYDIAHYPQRFQRNCTGSQANYTLVDDETVRVVNTCRKGSLDGKLSKVEGKAVIGPEGNPAKLRVQFFWPFRSDYWILAVDDLYQWAVVGDPSRESLWLLSRQPQISEAQKEKLLEIVRQKGFDPQQLVWEEQPPSPEAN